MGNNFDRDRYKSLLKAYKITNPGAAIPRSKLKAAATTGFNLGMYDLIKDDLNRDVYKQRLREIRKQHPEYNWRQRRAAALVDNPPRDRALSELPIEKASYGPFSAARADGNASIQVGLPEISAVIADPDRIKMTVYKNTYGPRTLSFNQFAGMLDDIITSQSAMSAEQDLNAWQVHRAKEYERYVKDPQNYVYKAIDPNFRYTKEDLARYQKEGLLSNNRSVGYYNPEDKRGMHMFQGKSWADIANENNISTSGTTYSFENMTTGMPVSDVQLSRIAHKFNPAVESAINKYLSTGSPIMRNNQTTVVVDQPQLPVGNAPTNNFYHGMRNVAIGTTALATLPAFMQYGATALRNAGEIAGDVIQMGREAYGPMLENNARSFLRQQYPGRGGNAWLRQSTTGQGPLRHYGTYGGARNLVWDTWKGMFKDGGIIK